MMGWWQRAREQSRFKKIMTIVVFFAGAANLFVITHFPGSSRERMLAQLVFMIAMLVWALSLALHQQAKRLAEQDTL